MSERISITQQHHKCEGLRPIFLQGKRPIGEREGLILILKQHGLKRSDFARITGYSTRTAESFFQGRREIPTLALIKLAFEISLIRQGKSVFNSLPTTKN